MNNQNKLRETVEQLQKAKAVKDEKIKTAVEQHRQKQEEQPTLTQ